MDPGPAKQAQPAIGRNAYDRPNRTNGRHRAQVCCRHRALAPKKTAKAFQQTTRSSSPCGPPALFAAEIRTFVFLNGPYSVGFSDTRVHASATGRTNLHHGIQPRHPFGAAMTKAWVSGMILSVQFRWRGGANRSKSLRENLAPCS